MFGLESLSSLDNYKQSSYPLRFKQDSEFHDSIRKSKTPNFRTMALPLQHQFTEEQPNFFSLQSDFEEVEDLINLQSTVNPSNKEKKQEVIREIIQRPIVKLQYNPRTYSTLSNTLENNQTLTLVEQQSLRLCNLLKQ